MFCSARFLQYLVLLTPSITICTTAFVHPRLGHGPKMTASLTLSDPVPAKSLLFSANSQRRRHSRLLLSSNDADWGGVGELTSALARLDQQYQRGTKKDDDLSWTKLVLTDKEENNNDNDNDTNDNPWMTDEERKEEEMLRRRRQEENDFVYLLEPSSSSSSSSSGSVPSNIILFVGGAGLGQFPHIAYDEFFKRLSLRTNSAVLAAPYTLGLDHFEIAKTTGEKLRRGLLKFRETKQQQQESNSNDKIPFKEKDIPVCILTHSLGGKLMLIHTAATGGGILMDDDNNDEGTTSGQREGGKNNNKIGMISFNNYGFSQSIGMARELAQTIRGNKNGGANAKNSNNNDDASSSPFGEQDMFSSSSSSSSTSSTTTTPLDQVFEFAQQAIGMVGLEFSPNPSQTEQILRARYGTEMQEKTRLFCLEQDKLDNSRDFLENCCSDNDNGNVPRSSLVSLAGVSGTHLTPVYFKFGLDKFPQEARGIMEDATGGFQSASFGNEEDLNELVTEVCRWMQNQPPSRPPEWADGTRRREGLFLTAAGVSSEKEEDQTR